MSSVGSNSSSNLTEENDIPTPMTVLVIDDDQPSRIICTMLEQCGYEATKCTSGTEGLQMLKQNKGKFDIVLTDVHMSNMDGFKLLEEIGLEMDLPVIMMTEDSSYEMKVKGLHHGACDYLIKPVKIEKLENIGVHVMNWRKANGNISGGFGDEDDNNDDDDE